MIEVDGKKYVSEEEFDKKVKEELREIAQRLARLSLEGAGSDADFNFMDNFETSMALGGAIAESYRNLAERLFGKKEASENE